jgi:hypothetical protein
MPSADPVEALAQRLAAIRRAEGRVSERDFTHLLDLLRARIDRLIRQYGLFDQREDARQAAAIGIHRALGSFDPAKARFVTHATWQMRGELQSLRHRIRLDQRRSAKSAGVQTVPLEALAGAGGVFEIVDDSAIIAVEAGASAAMAHALLERVFDRLDTPAHERMIVRAHLVEDGGRAMPESGLTAEQRRQVVRRTLRNGARVVGLG